VIALVLVMLAALSLGGYFAIPAWRRSRTPPELRGDWWSRFETDFRAYVERASREVRRRSRDRRPPPR
jgi:hypothetical protein